MELQIRVIEEGEILDNELDNELEILDITAMVAIDEIEAQEKTLKTNTKPLPTFTEPLDFNSTLAEMSIIEGGELLAVGSYEMAIERFHEAIRYSPNNKSYQSKLLEAMELAKLKNPTPVKNITGKLNGKVESPQQATIREVAKVSNPAPIKDTQEIFINDPLKDTQEVSINETLAEMSFIEANELLAKGELSAAIERFREAIKYSPDNALYAKKLNSVLSELKTNKTAGLKPLDPTKEMSKEDTKKNTKTLKPIVPSALLDSQAITKAEKAEIEGPITITTSSRPKTSKNAFLSIVVIIVLICATALFYQSRTASLIFIKQSYPLDQAKLNKQQLEFEWQSSGNRFLIQIEFVGKPIVQAYTEETRYKLTSDQINTIKIDTNYKWRVVPVNFKGEPLPYKTEEKWFEVVQ